MGTMLYNKEPMALVYNMDYYFQQKPPDCSLYSRDGCEFPVHKELFSQTKFMRKIVKNFSFDQCNFDSCCKMEILLPSLTKEELNYIIQFLYTGRVMCMDESYANQIYSSLTKVFGFPTRNFDFNGTMIKADLDGYENGWKTSVDLEEDWDDIKIYDDNPKVQAQIEDLSTENKSLAREVAFLKETIKDLTDDFDYRTSQNEMSSYEKKGKKIETFDEKNDLVDTAAYMDIPMDDIGDNYDDNYQDDDWEPDIKLKVKKENVSDDDYMPDKDVDFEFDENKPHRCPHCSKSFRKKSNLYGHIKKVHEGERPYPCHLCKKSFKMKQHLNKHIAAKHEKIKDEDGMEIKTENDEFKLPRKERTYTCEQCEQTFPRKMALNEHLMEIHGVKYECTVCQEQCKSNFSLNRHMINAHDMKKTYKCELCETEFTAKSSLIDHEKAVHNKTESHLCSFCGKNFNMKKNLRAHIAAIHERKEYPCPVPGCGEIFQSAFLMKAHNNLKHAGVKFECTSCKMEFKAKSSLARHIQFLHEGKVKSKFRCSLCDMQFAHKETLRKHTETVHQGKSYECHFCHESFKSEYILNGHITFTHEGKKGWECETCQAQFKAKHSLDNHIKAVHEGRRDHICFLCGKAFVRLSDLNTHLKSVHENTDKRYQCETCEKSYKSKQTLASHIESAHEGNKPSFKCSLCDKTFVSPHTMKRHIEVVHEKKKPFACNICTARFGQKPNLVAHLKAVHSSMGESMGVMGHVP